MVVKIGVLSRNFRSLASFCILFNLSMCVPIRGCALAFLPCYGSNVFSRMKANNTAQADQHIERTISSNGGISLVIARMHRLGMNSLFDGILGTRVKQALYSYSDIFLGWIYGNLCGAKRLEDIYTDNLYGLFKQIPVARLASPDSVARILKRFATPVEKIKKTSAEHEFNRNPQMNDLLLTLNKSLGLLSENEPYLLDFDGTITPTEKCDAKITYKKISGYAPSVALIGKIPVMIEARNGNTPAAFKVLDALEHTYAMLNKHNIKTWGIRMDAASYQKDVIYRLDELQQKFYIRVSNNQATLPEITITSWRTVDLHSRTEEIGSIELYPFDSKRKFRMIVTRFLKAAPKENEEKYVYRAIITNDYERTDLEIVRLYDQRGDSENNFRDLLNDFNWKRLPFIFMNENLVFMYVSAMAKCVYEYLIKTFSQHTKELMPHFKLKKFVSKFVRRVVTLWQQDGDDWSVDLLNLKEKFEALQSWAIRK